MQGGCCRFEACQLHGKMYLVMRDDGEGEVIVAAVDGEAKLTAAIVRDIGRRFPPAEGEVRDRVRFLDDAYRRHVNQYKLVVVA